MKNGANARSVLRAPLNDNREAGHIVRPRGFNE
jgi:hypothetical protein